EVWPLRLLATDRTESGEVNGESGEPPRSKVNPVEVILDLNAHPAENAEALGRELARFGDLFAGRDELLIVPDKEHQALHVRDGKGLARLCVDRARILLVDGAEKKAGLPLTGFLEMILGTAAVLGSFRPVDMVTDVPLYLPDFTLTMPGYNDGGPGHRVMYTGPKSDLANTPSNEDKPSLLVASEPSPRPADEPARLDEEVNDPWEPEL